MGRAAAQNSPTSPRPSPPPRAERGNRRPCGLGPSPLPQCGRGAISGEGGGGYRQILDRLVHCRRRVSGADARADHQRVLSSSPPTRCCSSSCWRRRGTFSAATPATPISAPARFSPSAPTAAVVLHKLTSLPLPVMMLVGGVMSGHRRFRHGLSDLAAEGRVFRDRHPGIGDRRADPDRQLGFCRRLARHLCHPAAALADLRQLHPVPLFADAGADLDLGRRSRGRSSARRSASASTRSATTSRRPRRRACRHCG